MGRLQQKCESYIQHITDHVVRLGHTHSYYHMQGPYTSGHLKFKAMQDFSGLFEKQFKTVLTTYVLLILSAVN